MKTWEEKVTTQRCLVMPGPKVAELQNALDALKSLPQPDVTTGLQWTWPHDPW